MGANTVSRPEGMREEAVFWDPVRTSAHGTVSVDPAIGRTGTGREMGVSSSMSTPLPSPLQSLAGSFYLGARVRHSG